MKDDVTPTRTANRHKPLDRNGRRIKIGDYVRIVGVPNLSGMSPEGVAECLPAFEHLVGKYKRVAAFDEYGCAEFSFHMRHPNGERSGHFVWIEPFLLHVPQPRVQSIATARASKTARRSAVR
jgi:hypothetical protein